MAHSCHVPPSVFEKPLGLNTPLSDIHNHVNRVGVWLGRERRPGGYARQRWRLGNCTRQRVRLGGYMRRGRVTNVMERLVELPL